MKNNVLHYVLTGLNELFVLTRIFQTSHWAAARAKMDVSKALAIMGFSSSRTLDHDAKTELNSALAKQMEIIGGQKLISHKIQHLFF